MAVKEYKRRQLLEMDACTNCGMCVEVCPAVEASGDGRLSGVYRIEGLRRLLRRRSGLLARLLKKEDLSEKMTDFGRTVFSCTLCSNCQEVCPVGLGLKDMWCSARADIVHEESGPQKITMIRDNLLSSRNVFDEENEERAEWVEDLRDPPDDGYVRDRAEVVYFTGCVASFFPLAQKIPMNLAEIFEMCDVDFTLLGEDEWCCGFPLLGAGLKEYMQEFIDHNMNAVRSRGARKIVFACPSCYQMWKEHYPPEFEIAHATEFMKDLIQNRQLNAPGLNLKVTYHDPCDLGRGARVFDAPRQVIRSLPGVELVELPENRENCRCCGGGGNLEMIDPDLSREITRLKIEDVLSTGAQAVVTGCQQCVRTMTGYVRKNNTPIEVMDITQLVHSALKGK